MSEENYATCVDDIWLCHMRRLETPHRGPAAELTSCGWQTAQPTARLSFMASKDRSLVG